MTSAREQYFERALTVAREHQVKSCELRAAMRMARLWHDQGKCDEATRSAAPVYGWFRRIRHARSEGGEGAAKRIVVSTQQNFERHEVGGLATGRPRAWADARDHQRHLLCHAGGTPVDPTDPKM
jgi:hypothetical protein